MFLVFTFNFFFGITATGAAVLRGENAFPSQWTVTTLGVCGFAGVRKVVVALKLLVLAPFRFVRDNPLGVGGVSWH